MTPPLTRQTLRGIWAALFTPWTDDDRFDEAMFVREINAYADTGVHGIYTGGTTGEFYAHDDASFERQTEIACEQARAIKLPIQIGCTTLSTRTTLKRIRIAERCGANGVQIALPFWLQITEPEAIAFYRHIGKSTDLPFTIYHTARSKLRLSRDAMVELTQSVTNFIGIKEPAATTDEVKSLCDVVPDLAVFVPEHSLLERMQVGAAGNYCAVSGLNPRLMANLYELCAAGQWDKAQPIQSAVHRLIFEVLHPWVTQQGLWDSAVDRVMRVAGGVDVGLRVQLPYRSATPGHVQQLVTWCRDNEPMLLPDPSS